MPALFRFENVEKFLLSFGLTMYDGQGKEIYPFKENKKFTPHLYCKRLWLYEEKKDKFTPASIKVEHSSFEVVQYKGYGPTRHKKTYDLSEKWQMFMLEEEGFSYATRLLCEAKENKRKLMDMFEKYEKAQKKVDVEARRELAKKLASESKKQMLAVMYLKGEQREETND